MAQTTGLVLAAGGIALANEVIFTSKGTDFNAINWRIIPATLILALTLAGLETLSPEFAKGLAGLTLGAVLIIPVGNAPTPLENVASFVNPKTGK